jgi:hypothetical protein
MVSKAQAARMSEWRIRQLPERVRKSLRMWALEDDISTNALIIRILTEAVDRHESER